MTLGQVSKLESKMDNMIQTINKREPNNLKYEMTAIITTQYVLSGRDNLDRIVYTKLFENPKEAFQFISGMYHILEEM